MNSIRLGCVKYLNARPLVRGWRGPVILDHPANLCRALAKGDLDIALVSSFEFLRNPIYRIVDDVSISSDGPVYSVVVAHAEEIADLAQIELDPAAETSVNLLRCLLSEIGLSPKLVETTKAELPPETGRLLIGDQAIQFREKHQDDLKFWDLGERWKTHAGMPFVYALWLVRPEVANANEIANQLRRLRDENLRNLTILVSDCDNPEFCGRYYREHLRFTFGPEAKAGLGMFHSLCIEHGLIPDREFKLELV